MNTPKSREGNFIRYIVYLIGYLMVYVVERLATAKTPLRLWDLILFGLVAAMVIIFYIYRFNREQRFFAPDFTLPWLGNLSPVFLLTLVITATRITISYLQSYGFLGLYNFQTLYLKHESVSMFWFLIVAQGLVLPLLQEFLASGFLFNYTFRKDTTGTAIWGIVVSGFLFSLLDFQTSPFLFLIEMVYGMLFAWAYLYSQTIWMPIYLAMVNGVLMVIMI